MEVVDRHGWVEGMTMKSYGSHIGFRSDQPGIIEQFHDLFPPGWERSDHVEVRRLYSLRTGGACRTMRCRGFRCSFGTPRSELPAPLEAHPPG